MGYDIVYSGQTARKIPVNKHRRISASWVLTGVVLLGLFAGGWKWLLPGDPEQTKSALSTLVEDVRAGDSLGEAVTAFCREIVAHEK